MKPSLAASVAGLALMATALAGCSSDPAPAPAAQATEASASAPAQPGLVIEQQPDSVVEQQPDPDDARAVFGTWLTAVEAGDGATACALETPEFTEQTLAESVESGIVDADATCEEMIQVASALIRAFGGMGFYETSVESSDGAEATVRVDYEGSDDGTFVMSFVDGEWLMAEEISNEADPAADFAETSARWLDNWCSVKVGMTRDEAVALMGEPTVEYGPEETSYPQVGWEQGGYSFVGFLDTNGAVRTLQGRYDNLGAADREQVTCPEVRR